MSTATASNVDWFANRFSGIATNIEKVIQGKRQPIEQILLCLVAEGPSHRGFPGVGKTLLASPWRGRSTVTSTGSSSRRTSSFESREFLWDRGIGVRLQTGSDLRQCVVGDEINRASPKTQAALLEQWRNDSHGRRVTRRYPPPSCGRYPDPTSTGHLSPAGGTTGPVMMGLGSAIRAVTRNLRCWNPRHAIDLYRPRTVVSADD